MKVVTREFLNDNAYRSYPIDTSATYEPYTDDGDVSTVNSLLLDMKLTIPVDIAAAVFVSNITVTPSLVTMTLMGVKIHPLLDVPPATESNEYYDTLGAYVLGTVQVKKSTAVSGAPIPITPQVDGVSGLVVFGPGVQNNSTWSFGSPMSSLVSTQAITRYTYSGVKTLGKVGFDARLDGSINLVGGGGVEVTAANNVVSLGFQGTFADIRNSLDLYRGECGGRPENGTCRFTPIKTVNYLSPYADTEGKRKLVVILDKPMYAYLDGDILEVSSDLPIESFCKGRINIPDPECPVPTPGTPVGTNAAAPYTLSIPPGLSITLDVTGEAYSASMKFAYRQQHSSRPTTGVFAANQTERLLGEDINELHIDVALNEWQLYSQNTASLKFFGPVYSNFRGSKTVYVEGKPYVVKLGRTNTMDILGYSSIDLRVDGPDVYEESGAYVRASYGEYKYGDYKILISTQPSTWSLYNGTKLLAAGPLSDDAVSTQIQNYSRADGSTAFKTYILVGG